MPTVNNRGRVFGGSAFGSSPGGATESAASDFPVAALSLFAGCVSYCVSNVCDFTLGLSGPARTGLAG